MRPTSKRTARRQVQKGAFDNAIGVSSGGRTTKIPHDWIESVRANGKELYPESSEVLLGVLGAPYLGR